MPDNGLIDTQFNAFPTHSSPNNPDSDNEHENEDLLNDDDFQPLSVKNHESFLKDADAGSGEDVVDELPMVIEEDENEEKSSQIQYIDEMSTPKSSATASEESKLDGIVLKNNEDNLFLNPNDISPILTGKGEESRFDEEYDNFPNDFDKDFCKRKRYEDDSFDNMSMISTDSYVGHGSAKKPKLTRTGSITRNLRRSMSFAAIKTPLSNMLRPRRSSVDPNASISSMTSMDSTFNESIKKPVKEKLRMIRDKITKPGKKDSLSTPKSKTLKIAGGNLDSLKKVCKFKPTVKTPENKVENDSCVGFKTPLAPPYPSFTFTPSTSSAHTIKTRSHTRTSTSSQATNDQAQSVDVVDNTNNDDDLLLIKKRRKEKLNAADTTSCVFNQMNDCPDADANLVFLFFIHFF
jgi:hypothetical protein